MTSKFKKNYYISDSESDDNEDSLLESEEDEDSSSSKSEEDEDPTPKSDEDEDEDEDEDSTPKYEKDKDSTSKPETNNDSVSTFGDVSLHKQKKGSQQVLDYEDKKARDDGFESFVKQKTHDWVTSTPQYGNGNLINDDNDDSVKKMDQSNTEISFEASKVVKKYERQKTSLTESVNSNVISPDSDTMLKNTTRLSHSESADNHVHASKTKTFVSESSASGVSESIINDSYISHETNNSQNIVEESMTQDLSRQEGEIIIEESTDSNSSDIQFIRSVTISPSSRELVPSSDLSTSGSKSDIEIANSNPHKEVHEIEDSDGDDNESKNEIKDVSIQATRGEKSDIAIISESSTNEGSGYESQKSQTNDVIDRSTLMRQIAAKTTAYQNIMRAIRGCDFSKLKDGGKLLQEKMIRCKEELDELKEKLKEGKHGGSPEKVKSKISPDPIFSTKDQVISNLGKKGIETHRVQAALTIDALVTIHESLRTCPDEGTFEKDPEGLVVDLLPHQKHALAWLLWRERQTPSGGILADDMGLGKTLSIISLVLRAEEIKRDTETECEEQGSLEIVDGNRTYKGSTLVVCPASLLGQWEGQINQHCSASILSVKVHHGKTRSYQAKQLARYDVVITTYGLLAEENKDEKRGILFRVRWERVVLDEAHIIRNHKTQKAVAACELIAKYRWCLTGTPVHNRELDMYSLLKFLRCSPFDDRAVWKRWVDNKSINGVQRLKTVIKSILLRRTKEDLKSDGHLKELPTKQLVPVYVDLDEEESKVYQKVLQFSKTLLAEYLHQKALHSGGGSERIESVRNKLKAAEDIKTTEIFVLLLRLRQICCLPGLIHAFLEKETCLETGLEPENPTIEDLYTQLSRLSVGGPQEMSDMIESPKVKNVLLKTNPVFKMNRRSTKIQTLLGIMEEILQTKDKIVIVSQWTNMLRNLEQHIRSLNVGIVTLDGTVPVKFRQKIIDDFNHPKSGVRIMLLSLNAGGVGLNLIGGNRLIIFEPHWNPQLESQACDRVYRVGQKKEVFIYKIICKNTIEERIELLQKKKLELAENILEGVDPSKKSQGTQLSLPDLVTLFEL